MASIQRVPRLLEVLLAALVAWPPVGSAGVNEWTPVGPPGRSDVRRILVDPHVPNTLYALTDGGLFKTMTGGMDWHRVLVTVAPGDGQAREPDQIVLDPSSPGTLYDRTTICEVSDPPCATPQADVLRSTDGGASWTRLRVPLGPADRGAVAIAVGASNPATLYVATGDAVGTIVKTVDGGATWQRTVPINPNPFFPNQALILGLVLDPGDSATVYAPTSYAGLHKTFDAGMTWFPGGLGRVNFLAIAPSAPSTLFAVEGSSAGTRLDPCASGRSQTTVFRSTDGGTWVAATRGLEHVIVGDLAVDPRSSDVVWASATCDLFTTRSGGVRWVPTGLGTADMIAFDAATPGTVYAVTGGIMRLEVVECRTTADCDDGDRSTADACALGDAAADFRGCTNRCLSNAGCARWDPGLAGVSGRRPLRLCVPHDRHADTHGCRYATGDQFGASDLLADLANEALELPPCDTGLRSARLAGFVRRRVAGAQDALYQANQVRHPARFLRRASASVGHALGRVRRAGAAELDDVCRQELVSLLRGARRGIRLGIRRRSP